MYRPTPDSLAARVIGFFALNPDEELHTEDVIEKFGDASSTRNVHTQLMMALDHDMVAWDPEACVYRKGPVDMPSVRPEREKFEAPQIDLREVVQASAPAPRRAPRRTAASAASTPAPENAGPPPEPTSLDAVMRYKRGAVSTYAIDVQAIELEDGIPIPSKRVGNDWPTLFARFKVGQSLLLPIALKTRLNAAAKEEKKLGRGTFTIRVQPDGSHFRIWMIK